MIEHRLIVPTTDLVIQFQSDHASMNNIHIDWEETGKHAVDVTNTLEEYQRFLVISEDNLSRMDSDDWVETRAFRNFVMGLSARLDQMQYYHRPVYVRYAFDRWVGQDMALITLGRF